MTDKGYIVTRNHLQNVIVNVHTKLFLTAFFREDFVKCVLFVALSCSGTRLEDTDCFIVRSKDAPIGAATRQ